MDSRLRGALTVSAVLIVGMSLYVVFYNARHERWAHKRAVASQEYYARHGRDSMLNQVEFRPLDAPAITEDTVSFKYQGPARLEYYDGASPNDRRLLARITVVPQRDPVNNVRCEVFFRPMLRLGNRPAYPASDSVWRKVFYLHRERDSTWKKVPVSEFPDRKGHFRAQVVHDSL